MRTLLTYARAVHATPQRVTFDPDGISSHTRAYAPRLCTAKKAAAYLEKRKDLKPENNTARRLFVKGSAVVLLHAWTRSRPALDPRSRSLIKGAVSRHEIIMPA